MSAASPSTAEEAVLRKMEDAGAHPVEVAAMSRRMRQLSDPAAGLMAEGELQPLPDLPELDRLPAPDPAVAGKLLARFAVVKLNGGLGTSMGLTGPKSLLLVKNDLSFLDVIARQVLALRRRFDVQVPLLLMNSAATKDPSLDALAAHPDLPVAGLPLDFLQGREPKLRAQDLMPAQWPSNPELEWCPPGHGDLYTALSASGVLAQLLDRGVRWCFVSNADNLGAVLDVRLAAWITAEQVPFTMEAVRGTPADRKGGHLALRDGQVVVRETAQVPAGDTSFTDIDRWRYYNTNNLWVDLAVLQQLQQQDPAAPHLPLIVNRKTVDPRDKTSTPVLQLETAMGAAVGSIPGARAVCVPRDRFAPVKTTNDLMVVRSDAYRLTEGAALEPTYRGDGPVVTLDDTFFKNVPDFDRRVASGVPSLRECTRLTVDGDVVFGADVVVRGDVHLTGPRHIPDGTHLQAKTQ